MTEQADHLVVRDLAQIKALADPLRHRILGALSKEPRTTMQVAAIIAEPPTKLYRHVELLHRLGLIRLVRTEPKRGTTEKYFEAVARSFSLSARSLTDEARGSVEELFGNAFDDILLDVRSAVASGALTPSRVLLATGLLRVRDGDLPELQRRLQELTHEFDAGDSDPQYKLVLTLCPARNPD